MFALKTNDGKWVMSRRTGKRMTWSERRLARMAQKAIEKHRKIRCTVVEA